MWTTILAFFGKGWERFVSIAVYLLVFVGLIWACYVAFVRPTTKPNPSTTQTGGISYNYQIKLGFGSCARITK